MPPPAPAARPVAPPPMGAPPRRPSGPPPSTDTGITAAPALNLQVTKPQPIVPKIFFYAGEKFGKTTFASFAPSPLVVQARDTGYQTLLNAGLVPAVPAATVDTWTDTMAIMDVLGANPQDRKTLVLDGITGLERLCHEWVCSTYFKNDWSDAGFLAYHKGFDLAVPEWMKFLAKLDKIHAQGVTIVLIGHARTKEQKNPVGANYDRFEPDVHAKTWGPTAKWADAILFGKFHTIVEQSRRDASKSIAEAKGKAIGGIERVVFTSPCDAWVAGNRFGMEPEIWLTDVRPEGMWDALVTKQMSRQPATT